jgi:hypothetical protein
MVSVELSITVYTYNDASMFKGVTHRLAKRMNNVKRYMN